MSAEEAISAGQNDYNAKRYLSAAQHFTTAMRLCKCNRGVKRYRCSCKRFETVANNDGSIFHEAMYTCTCSAGKTFNKCDNPLHIKALDYRAATFEALNELERARRDAEWILELAPRLPDGYLRLGKVARLQQKHEYAWKIYTAGIDTGRANGMATHPKFGRLCTVRNKLQIHFARRDPISLPAEVLIQTLNYCDLATKTRCLRVSKKWNSALSSIDFAALWKVLDFTGPSMPRRPLQIDTVKKLVAKAGRDVQKIAIDDRGRNFHLSDDKFMIMLQGSTRLEYLRLGFQDDDSYVKFQTLPIARHCRRLKTLHLSFCPHRDRSQFPNHEWDVKSACLHGLLFPVAQFIETLHICHVPFSWAEENNVPYMTKLKNLKVKHPGKKLFLLPIMYLSEKMPFLEQLWLDDAVPSFSRYWRDDCHGHKLEHFDLDLPQMSDSRDLLINPLTVNPASSFDNMRLNRTEPFIDSYWRDFIDLDWRNEFKSLQTVRLGNQVVDPDGLQQAIGGQAATGKLHTLDIVFPDEPLFSAATGVVSQEHLEKYNWLVGAPGIRSMAVSNFRFRPFPRTPKELPLPSFLASFPKLESLEIRSKHYDERELCSVISAILREATQVKTIYQSQIRGVLMDELRILAERQGAVLVWGEKPRLEEWPIPLEE